VRGRNSWKPVGALAAIALAFLAVRPLAHAPARLVAACPKWIGLAAILELVSLLGFVLVFALALEARLSRRHRLRAGFRALGAISVLPAGGLVGPAVAARAASTDAPLPALTRSTIALTILTNAPGLLVLGGLGFSLWLGWPQGPHAALLTLPEAGIALAVGAGVWLIGRPSRPGALPKEGRLRVTRRRYLTAGITECREGASEARRLLVDGNWKLAGAVGYYAFDNAALWAAFYAYGRGAPPISVIVMGYLVGSLGAALPLPAGIGAVEGGLIGALMLYGAPAGPAAGAVLLYRGISLSLPVILGAAAWGRGPRRRPRSPDARAIVATPTPDTASTSLQ
jgi:uncharacterized membrane protein YbhN (UPF0104 family)